MDDFEINKSRGERREQSKRHRKETRKRQHRAARRAVLAGDTPGAVVWSPKTETSRVATASDNLHQIVGGTLRRRKRLQTDVYARRNGLSLAANEHQQDVIKGVLEKTWSQLNAACIEQQHNAHLSDVLFASWTTHGFPNNLDIGAVGVHYVRRPARRAEFVMELVEEGWYGDVLATTERIDSYLPPTGTFRGVPVSFPLPWRKARSEGTPRHTRVACGICGISFSSATSGGYHCLLREYQHHHICLPCGLEALARRSHPVGKNCGSCQLCENTNDSARMPCFVRRGHSPRYYMRSDPVQWLLPPVQTYKRSEVVATVWYPWEWKSPTSNAFDSDNDTVPEK